MAILFRRGLHRKFSRVAAKVHDVKEPNMAELEDGAGLPNIHSDAKNDPYTPELDTTNPQLPELYGAGTPNIAPRAHGGERGGRSEHTACPEDPPPGSSATGHPEPELPGSQPAAWNNNIQTEPLATSPAVLQHTPETAQDITSRDSAIEKGASTSERIVEDVPAHGSEDELNQLLKLDGELEDKWRALEQIRQVREQQAAIRDRIKELRSQRDSGS